MEQSRRRFLYGIGLVLVLAAAGGAAWALLRGRAEAPRSAAARIPSSGAVRVEVLNGTAKRGLARAATRVLRQAGFDVVYFGTTGTPVRVTEVLARRGDSTAAASAARALGAGRARIARDTLLRVDLTVLLGEDYRPPPGIRP